MTKDVYTYCQKNRQACLPVIYEQLLLRPVETMANVVRFLNTQELNETLIDDALTAHHVNSKDFNELFNWWRAHFPANLLQQVASLAPMMHLLGYDADNTAFNFTLHNKIFQLTK